jgi:hypothetical protein
MEGAEGVTAMDINATAATVSVVEPVTFPDFAEIVALP